jgi:CheY-like chemotaxis protein
MGLKALLVEDDENKQEQVKHFLLSTYQAIEIDLAESFQTALKKALSTKYQLVVLDMTIPTFDKEPTGSAGSLRALGGKDLLDQFNRKRIVTNVVVLTGYDILGSGKDAAQLEQVASELSSQFPKLFRGAVFYSRGEVRWKTELKAHIDAILPSLEIGT